MGTDRSRIGYSWARASAVMMSAILASRLLGIFRDTVIAYRFGQNELTDAYRAAFQLPDLLFFMVAGGALSSALMPVFSRYWETNQKEEAWRVFSSVAIIMVSLIVGLVVALEIATAPAIALMFPGFEAERRDLTVMLTRIVLPTQIFFLMGGLMMATLYTRKHFFVPALGPNIYNLGIIFGGLVLALWFGIAGLAWGAVLGAFLGSVVLPMVVMARLGSQFRWRVDWHLAGVKEVFRMMLPVMFGLSLPGVYMLILRVFASSLPAGSISALDNANRQMQAPLGVIGQGVALAIFPALTTLASTERWSEMRAVLKRGLRLVWFLTTPATVLLWILSEDISRVILQYGKFGSEDTELVASALRGFSLGLFAWSGQALIARAYFAMRNALTPVLIGSATTALFVPLCFLFVNAFGMEHVGLALATSVSAGVQMVWMLWVLRKRLPKGESADSTPFIRPVVMSGVSALVMGIVGWWFHGLLWQGVQALDLQVNFGAFMALVATTALVMSGYLGVCRRLGVPEVEQVWKVLNRRDRS